VKLDVIEPNLKHDPRVLLAVVGSLGMTGVSKNVNLVAGFSPEKVIELAEGPLKKR
jgi:hypothetical protein